MTFCILCQVLRGIERRAAPVEEGLPLCVECRNPPMHVEIDVMLGHGPGSAATMMRYATRLAMAGGATPSPQKER